MTNGSQPTSRLRAAIVGGGIGGLVTACSLHRRGIEVAVFERADELGEVGAGLSLFPNGLRHLERMGLGAALAAVGAKVGHRSRYCRADGTVVGPMLTTDSSGWNGIYGMHRADLLNVLASSLPPKLVNTGHYCTGFEQSAASACVKFADGKTVEADIVIAADGIHSTLQKYVVAPKAPEYSGVRAYRGLIPRGKLGDWPDETQQVWMGDGKHFIVYPVRGGRVLNYVGFVRSEDAMAESWSAIGDRDELASSFDGWDPYVVRLLEAVETCFWWGLYDRPPLESWTNGRLTLLGDAAHPMLPHLGQGANQTIEDGVALSVLLEGRDPAEVPNVAKQYERLRRARTDMVQAEARKNGLRYDSRYGSLEQRDREIANSAAFRRSLFDYDVESAAIAQLDGANHSST